MSWAHQCAARCSGSLGGIAVHACFHCGHAGDDLMSSPSTVEQPLGVTVSVKDRIVAELLKLRALLALAILILVFSISNSSFLSTNNFTILTKHISITALLAI